MQGTRMLGNDKVSSMQGARMPGNRQCTQKNTRNRQCTQKKYSESSMYTEKILGIVNARCKNAGKRQSMLQKCSEVFVGLIL